MACYCIVRRTVFARMRKAREQEQMEAKQVEQEV